MAAEISLNDALSFIHAGIRSRVSVPVVLSLTQLEPYKLFSYGDCVVNVHGVTTNPTDGETGFFAESEFASETINPFSRVLFAVTVTERLGEKQKAGEDQLFLNKNKNTIFYSTVNMVREFLLGLGSKYHFPHYSGEMPPLAGCFIDTSYKKFNVYRAVTFSCVLMLALDFGGF